MVVHQQSAIPMYSREGDDRYFREEDGRRKLLEHTQALASLLASQTGLPRAQVLADLLRHAGATGSHAGSSVMHGEGSPNAAFHPMQVEQPEGEVEQPEGEGTNAGADGRDLEAGKDGVDDPQWLQRMMGDGVDGDSVDGDNVSSEEHSCCHVFCCRELDDWYGDGCVKCRAAACECEDYNCAKQCFALGDDSHHYYADEDNCHLLFGMCGLLFYRPVRVCCKCCNCCGRIWLAVFYIIPVIGLYYFAVVYDQMILALVITAGVLCFASCTGMCFGMRSCGSKWPLRSIFILFCAVALSAGWWGPDLLRELQRPRMSWRRQHDGEYYDGEYYDGGYDGEYDGEYNGEWAGEYDGY